MAMLDETEEEGVSMRRPALLIAGYVAQGIRAVTYLLAPERVVVGGGVARLPGFHRRLRSRTAEVMAGYPGLAGHDGGSYVVAPALGDMSGPLGGLILAGRALEPS